MWFMLSGYGAEGEQRVKLSGKRTGIRRILWKDADDLISTVRHEILKNEAAQHRISSHTDEATSP